jgi:hypothetical protein
VQIAQGGFGPWSTYKTGAYQQFMHQAGGHVEGLGSSAAVSGTESHAAAIQKAVQALKEFDAKAREAKKLAKINLQIEHLQQFKVWQEAVDGLKTKMKELASQAAQAWRTLEQQRIQTGPLAEGIKAERKEEEAEETKRTETDLAKRLKEAKGTGNKAEIKAVEEEITKFKRQQDIKRKEEAEQAEESALEAQTKNYEDTLGTQLEALTKQLAKGVFKYAEYATRVNMILKSAGIAYTPESILQGTLGAGPGPSGPAIPVRTEHGRVYFSNGMWVTEAEFAGGIVPSETSGVRVGHRRYGGPVVPGVSYMVGEAGPELFTPGATGAITPAPQTAELVGAGHKVDIHGGMHVTNRQDVDRWANRTAFRLRYG